MARKRKAYAPFSLTSEAGVGQTPVEGYIEVDQTIYPTVSTGTVNENGKWTGVKSSDDEFFAITKHVAIPDGGETLSPDTGTINFIDMTGFSGLFFAIKPSNGGNYATVAVMGPDTERFANLDPVDSGASLRGTAAQGTPVDLENLYNDGSQGMTADKWNIFFIANNLANQKLLQMKVTNNSGGNSDIEVAFMRTV